MTELLPIKEMVEPADHDEVAAVIKDCCASSTPVYPIGGGTSLGYGLPPRRPGIGLSLAKLNRIIDYPARDMTVTAEAGLTQQDLSEALAGERQQLPLDVPDSERATLGGIVATNSNGPRRFGYGTVRDHVIGIRAIDGCGTTFHGGGRVVKNVAGYDFCKLLTGSLGTLAVITQLTLKLKPLPPATTLLACRPRDLEHAEELLAALVHSQTTPAAVELLGGPAWRTDPLWQQLDLPHTSDLLLAALLEGTELEVGWMTEQLGREWGDSGITDVADAVGNRALGLMQACSEFPAGESPLVIKINVVPSHTARMIAAARRLDADCSFQAHAGNGVVIVRLSEFPAQGLSKSVIGHLQPAARAGLGNLIILANPSGAELTRHSVWGTGDTPLWLMEAVKKAFDPAGILNPDRFVYSY